MFFLLKCVFWLGLVFVLLPPEGDPRGAEATRMARQAAQHLEQAAAGAAKAGVRHAQDACLAAPKACLEAARAIAVLPPRRPSADIDGDALRREPPG